MRRKGPPVRPKQQYKKPGEMKTARGGGILKITGCLRVLVSAGCFHLVKTFQVEKKSLGESKVC